MLECQDLTVIWDSERTRKEWLILACKEYWSHFGNACSQPLDSLDNMRFFCNRVKGHIGPCLSVGISWEKSIIKGTKGDIFAIKGTWIDNVTREKI